MITLFFAVLAFLSVIVFGLYAAAAKIKGKEIWDFSGVHEKVLHVTAVCIVIGLVGFYVTKGDDPPPHEIPATRGDVAAAAEMEIPLDLYMIGSRHITEADSACGFHDFDERRLTRWSITPDRVMHLSTFLEGGKHPMITKQKCAYNIERKEAQVSRDY